MTHQIFGRFVRTALAVAMLAGAQFAAAANTNTGAEVVAGSVVRLGDGAGSLAGVFNGSVMSGLTTVGSFKSFCLERYEYFSSYTQNLYVKSVSTATMDDINANPLGGSGGSPTNGYHTISSDPISFATAYLYTQFYNGTLGGYTGSGADNDELQKAIWALENEVTLSSLGTTGKDITWYNQANAAGWTSLGNVRVLNLFTDANYTKYSQDQLYMVSAVPEPETYAMMLAGLGLIGTIARRRKNKSV